MNRLVMVFTVAMFASSALAQQPVMLFVAPAESKVSDYRSTDLDALITQALSSSAKAKAAPESVADVVVKPEVSRTDAGKIRISFALKNRLSAATERVAFDFNSTRFGLGGVTTMLNGVATKAAALRDRPADGPTTTATGPRESTGTDAPFGADGPDETNDVPRFRWGISGGAGTFIPGPLFSLGAEARAGWQFNRIFSLYGSFGGNVGFMIAGSLDPTMGSLNVGADAYYAFGVQAEAVFQDMLFVAGGPHLVRGGWAFVGQSIDAAGGISQRAYAAGGGFMPGVNLKVGLGLGSRNEKTGRRNQFTIALDTMFLFAPDTVTGSQVVNMNGISQQVEVRGLALGVAPVIMLGFDGR